MKGRYKELMTRNYFVMDTVLSQIFQFSSDNFEVREKGAYKKKDNKLNYNTNNPFLDSDSFK